MHRGFRPSRNHRRMGGPTNWELRRAVALAAVVALHVALVILLAVSLRTATRLPSSEDFVTSLILLPSAPRPAVYRLHPPTPNESRATSTVEPLTMPLSAEGGDHWIS